MVAGSVLMTPTLIGKGEGSPKNVSTTHLAERILLSNLEEPVDNPEVLATIVHSAFNAGKDGVECLKKSSKLNESKSGSVTPTNKLVLEGKCETSSGPELMAELKGKSFVLGPTISKDRLLIKPKPTWKKRARNLEIISKKRNMTDSAQTVGILTQTAGPKIEVTQGQASKKRETEESKKTSGTESEEGNKKPRVAKQEGGRGNQDGGAAAASPISSLAVPESQGCHEL